PPLCSHCLPLSLISTLFPYTTLFRSLGFDRCAPVTHRPMDGIRIRAVAREGFSKHPRIRATDDGSERISARGTRVRRPSRGCGGDRKSIRLNSSHVKISYAVFCLKKK